MTDKEVGELWLECRKVGWTSDTYQIPKLIRKLVKERNNQNDDWGLTLQQFGIPPETWHDE